MSLPDLIEIVPPVRGICSSVSVPGSKSITNRALVLAALSDGEVLLRNALWSEDTQVMVQGLTQLGFSIRMERSSEEPSNRHLRILGLAGKIPRSGTANAPLDLFVANAGTATRFLMAMVCLGHGFYRLHGVPRMHRRPQSALINALGQLGYTIQSDSNRLPVVIEGRGPLSARAEVSIEESSQFASALMLAATRGGWKISVVGENPEESPYIAMTGKLIQAFPMTGGSFAIEPDASSGSYFWAANWLLQGLPSTQISVGGWPTSDWQVDSRFPRTLPLPSKISRQGDLGDSIMTAMILAPFGEHPTEFQDLGRLRLQECERVAAMRTELSRCGAIVEEQGDNLLVKPSPLHGATIETYEDHRMAMCFAILGLKVPGIKIKNPGCVRKTFPDFFQKLSNPAPLGLGVALQGADGSLLSGEQLLALEEKVPAAHRV